MDEGSVGPHQQGRLTHAVEHRLHRFHPPVSRGEPTPDRQHATKGGGEAVEALDGLRIEGPLISPPMDGDYSRRSEEHTSELQSLMRISYAVFCLTKKNNKRHT